MENTSYSVCNDLLAILGQENHLGDWQRRLPRAQTTAAAGASACFRAGVDKWRPPRVRQLLPYSEAAPWRICRVASIHS
jgi:hypothetical protein